jgi:hypothetical protein
MRGTTAGAAPLVEVLATEEQLAPAPVLLRRDRTFDSELPQRVSMETEVVGGGSRIHPLGRDSRSPRLKASQHGGGHAIGQLLNHEIQQCVISVSVEPRRLVGGDLRHARRAGRGTEDFRRVA